MENISKHWVSIFTWRKMVIHQLETDGKYTNMETLVNVLNSLWLYRWWLEAIWGLISNSVSLSISLSADVPESWFFPFLFHFPEIECCWAGWEICVEVQQAEKLRRALCAGRGWHQCSTGGPNTQGMGWALQLVDVFPHVPPTASDCCISSSAEVTHQPLFPTQFQIFVKSSVKAMRTFYILQKLMTEKSQTGRQY